MNPIDIASVAVLALSAAFGLMRGFVREALGLAAWIGAILLAIRLFPVLDPEARRLIENTVVADIAASAAGFIVLIIVFSIIASIIGGIVQASLLGGIDRALGLLFGAARGVVIVVAAYILGNLLLPVGQWPGMVRGARATPLAYQGAAWAVSLVPEHLRPHIEAPGGGVATITGRAVPSDTVAYRQGE